MIDTRQAPRIRHVPLLLSILPPILAITLVITYGQKLPWADDWAFSQPIAIKTSIGSLAISDLTAQANDSRLVFTNLLTAISTVLFQWNPIFEMLCGIALATISYFLLLHLFRRTNPENNMPPTIWLVFSVLIFNLTQHVNLLWAIQSAQYFVLLFLVLTVWSLMVIPRGTKALLIAGLCALCATFSYANGILTWLLIPFLMYHRNYRSLPYYLLYVLLFIGSITLYFHDYTFYVGSRNPLTLNPFTISRWTLAFLGGPITAWRIDPSIQFHYSYCAGALGLILLLSNTAYLLKKKKGATVVPWFALALFVVCSAVIAAASRLENQGIVGAVATRYLSLSTMFWISVFALSFSAATQGKGNTERATGKDLRLLNYTAFALSGLSFLLATVKSIPPALPIPPQTLACAIAYPNTSDTSCLAQMHPAFNPYRETHPDAYSIIKRRLDEVIEHRLTIYAESR